MLAGSNVFIGTNDIDTANDILRGLSNPRTARATLEESYYTRGTIGHDISRRYAGKLSARVFSEAGQKQWVEGGTPEDSASRRSAVESASLVRRGGAQRLDATDRTAVQAAFAGTGQVHVVVGSKAQEGRHAEERLMDVLETADYKGTVTVAGKMRPCTTCAGRMDHVRSKGYGVSSSRRHGRIWKTPYDAQADAERAATLKLLDGVTYETAGLGSHYGTQSSSEGQSDASAKKRTKAPAKSEPKKK